MRCELLHLKDCFDFLGDGGCDPRRGLYLPDNLSGVEHQKRPCILICPGGGYEFCSDRESEVIALQFLGEGYNVFVLTYSVAPHRFPAQLREVAAAMELIARKGEDWSCDPTRVAIMGFSAGGHLAAHYSTCYDCAEVRQVFPDSKPVRASILCYPVITADAQYAHLGSFRALTGRDSLSEADVERFSCDRCVDADTPQAFLWHTAGDGCVPVMNSLLYAGALARYHIPFELHVYPFGDHGLATADEQTCGCLSEKVAHVHGWLHDAKKWLKLVL